MSIVTDIQLLLNDAGVFWPLSQVLDAVNQAQLWMYAQSKWQRTSYTLPLTTGQDLVPLPSGVVVPGWIESTVVLPNGGGNSSNRAFPTTHRELEAFSRLWRDQQPAQPQYFVIWDASTLRVFPRPDQSYIYTLWGVGFPPEITDASTSLSGVPSYTRAVQYYTLALLLEATRPDLADVYTGQAQDALLAYKKALRNQQSHNIRRLVPQVSAGRHGGDAGLFAQQQSGQIRQLPVYYPIEA